MDLKTTKMLASVENGIGWITFNQPEKRNAISLSMWAALGTILENFDQDPEVRVVVMKGAGDQAFVSGADISEFEAQRSNARQRAEYGEVAAAANRGLASIDKPLIAMIQGYCIGGGLATALSADVRFATPDSTFGIPAARLGLGYEMSGLRALLSLVGPSHARDIMISARYFKAAEALQMGLINFVVEPEALAFEVTRYAQTIAGNAPMTIRAARRTLRELQKPEQQQNPIEIQRIIDECFDSRDYREGRLAFREKRTPKFEGR
ncbi:MAG: enoyl-CoA hydratase [Pseudomonadales bacterium]